jgi:hypothetical protein
MSMIPLLTVVWLGISTRRGPEGGNRHSTRQGMQLLYEWLEVDSNG